MAAVPDPEQTKLVAQASQALRDRGVGLFAAFTAATLLMVVAIAAVGLVDAWWVLIPVMVVDFVVTFAVVSGIGRLLSDDGDQ